MEHDPPKLRRPSRARLVDGVLRSLEDAILSGDVAPGSRLVEVTIANQLGVSRTTVREAFLMLEKQGLVVSRPRKGTFVTRISDSDALDLGRTRALLESYAITVGRDRITPELLSNLEDLVLEMARCKLPGDLPELLAIDLAFHRKLVESSEMPRLIELWSNLDGQIGALYIRAIEEHATSIDFVISIHDRYLTSIRSGDSTVACQAVIEHYIRFNALALPIEPELEHTVETLAQYADDD
jgi:DNA-binding GntR family transcriptional regulator